MDDRLSIPSVTGTDLEFNIAGPGGRSYAFVIDWHIRLLLGLAWLLAASALYAGARALIDDKTGSLTGYAYVAVLPAAIIYLLYHPVIEILMHGRTPGKRMAGIRIVTRDGQTPSVGAHLVRNIFRLVDGLPGAYLIGLITTLLTENNVRFGDMAAGTVLIYDATNEKKALREVEAIYGSGLGVKESELVQEMIARWSSIEPGTRKQLGRSLLQKLGMEVRPGTSDDELLSQLKAQLD